MTIREVIADAMKRFLETYFGEDGTEMDLFMRMLCCFLGTLSLFFVKLSNLAWSEIAKAPMIPGVLFVAGIVLAIVVGASVKRGGALRFYLLGVALYSGLLLAAATVQLPAFPSEG